MSGRSSWGWRHTTEQEPVPGSARCVNLPVWPLSRADPSATPPGVDTALNKGIGVKSRGSWWTPQETIAALLCFARRRKNQHGNSVVSRYNQLPRRKASLLSLQPYFFTFVFLKPLAHLFIWPLVTVYLGISADGGG